MYRDIVARRYGLWLWDDRITETLGTYRQPMLLAVAEDVKTKDDIHLENFVEAVKLMIKLVDIHGSSIITAMIMGNPYIKRKRPIKSLFGEDKRDQLVTMPDGNTYRIVE